MAKLKRGFLWVTLLFFAVSLVAHWGFAWASYVDEQREHGQPVEFRGYAIQTARDTFENWQSEFLQLMWQVCGLAWLLYIGSPQSKEGDARREAKLDLILQRLEPADGAEIIAELDRKYPRS